MPQYWEEHWTLVDNNEHLTPEKIVKRKEDRNRLIHPIGNLSLLNKSLNPAVSKGPLAKKRDQILDHNTINLNRFLRHQYTQNEKRIKERGNQLFTIAKKCWPHPNSEFSEY